MTDRPYTQPERIYEIEDIVREHEPVTIERIVEMLDGQACLKTVHRDLRFLERRRRVTMDPETRIVVFVRFE